MIVGELKGLDVEIRVTFSNPNSQGDGVFGKDMALLLEGVERLGSINASAKSLRVAYTYAWHILKDAETSFGFPLVDRDGARGSTLTPRGRQLLTTYRKLSQKGTEAARQSFLESIA
jgi:molybdate transport system regulatory protein